MKHLALPGYWSRAAVIAAVLCLWAGPWAQAQEEGPATSKGENFSARPPAALFASDCTGSDCHRGPQGLSKGKSLGGLAGFLREHYTNSRESAAALAGYLMKLPAGPEPREVRTPRAPRKPAPEEARAPREHPGARASRASAKPEEDGAAAPKPAHSVRAQRGRQQPAAEPPPLPEPAPSEPAPPAPKKFDIFD
jgi:hypothetical protein